MSIKRTKTGDWCFRTVVRFPDGTRERVYGTPGIPGPYHDLPRTKVGATEAERRAIAEAMSGKSAPPPEPKEEEKTIREHAVTFRDLYKPGSKPSERRGKAQILDGHLLAIFGDRTISDLGQVDIDTFSSAELKRGCAPKTVNNRLAVLSSLIRYATGERSQLRFKIDGMGSEIFAVPSSDVERLLDAGNDPRYGVAVLLAAEAGLRAGEIRGAQWTDVKDGQLTVRRALDNATDEVIAPKHNKTRTVPLSPRLIAALATLPRRGVWIVSRLDGDALGYYGLRDAILALYDRAGVPLPPKPIHCLRHTFGTVMARKVPLGVLQKLMGHADVSTTMRYVHVEEDDKRSAIAAVFGVAATWQPASGALDK